MEVKDIRRDNQWDRSSREDEAGDWELPLGAGLDVGVEGSGVEGGDAGEEVAAETVAAGGAGGVFAVGGNLEAELVGSGLVRGDGERLTM
jgi:hypothetical protein